MSLSAAQIAAQLERVLSSDPTTVALAIRATARQLWPASLNQRGRQFEVRWCESPLAIREALCDIEQKGSDAGLVVVTPLQTHELAEDVAARLARARVFQPEGWEMVRHLFHAKDTDARLARYPWMPQMLIDGAAERAYTPVANGFLGLEMAWREVLDRLLQIPVARPDVVGLLQWSTNLGGTTALQQLPTNVRADVIQWLSEAAGAAGGFILACIEGGRAADALPLGLVCGVIFSPEAEGQAALGQAAIRIERFVDDRHVGVSEGRAWATAAEEVVRAAGVEASRAALDRADILLRELKIAEYAHQSDLLPAGLDQRMRELARALSAMVEDPTAARLSSVDSLTQRVLLHASMERHGPRAERIEMARRLSRWMLAATCESKSLRELVAWQADEGAFVDWARFRLLGGDELPELSEAYGACRSAVIRRRAKVATAFSQALADWNAGKPVAEARLVPVEAVLDRVLAPLSASNPVLLLVMDGLSISIFRELFARAASYGWAEWVPGDLGAPLVGVAALPTITEVSRASLLCGRLAVGAAAFEKTGFAASPSLLAQSRPAGPPKLFHKGDLADATNLAPEVRSAIADPNQRVVGVVYNAVDDHLSGPDQLHQRWTLEDLRLLLPLLREAREARRVLVVTADHGHLLEDGTTQLPGGESDRWRPGGDARQPHELAIKGGRVLAPGAAGDVVCLWGEGTRYGGRKNGYHGGVSPQEVTVPLSILAPLGVTVPDWSPAPPVQPEWWELAPALAVKEPAPKAAPAPRQAPKRSADHAGQTQLFDMLEPQPLPAAEPADWMAVLFDSTVYASQRKLAARVAIPDETMRLLLTVLAERGGKLSRLALAQRLSVPELRLGGLLSAVRRVLNVDQAPVLRVDEAAGMVELNLVLLRQQFRLNGHEAKR
jgi:hypothetical protein